MGAAERDPLSEAELDRLSELILDKLLRRLAKAAAAPVTIPPPANANAIKPRPEVFAALAERRARRGRRRE